MKRSRTRVRFPPAPEWANAPPAPAGGCQPRRAGRAMRGREGDTITGRAGRQPHPSRCRVEGLDEAARQRSRDQSGGSRAPDSERDPAQRDSWASRLGRVHRDARPRAHLRGTLFGGVGILPTSTSSTLPNGESSTRARSSACARGDIPDLNGPLRSGGAFVLQRKTARPDRRGARGCGIMPR